MSFTKPVNLENDVVRLEPLGRQHVAEASDAVQDGRLWEAWYTFVPEPARMAADIDARLALQAQGSMCPFVVRDKAGRFVGMTTYMNIDAVHRRVEIGATWYRKSQHGTGLNGHCKFLLLEHAFETLQCIAVELRTHVLNQRSRGAIEKIGARLDGILRHHMVMPNGTLRDTAVYSITATDWPAVRAHLSDMNRR